MRTWARPGASSCPPTHFTENPFANWTRGGSQATGFFTLDLDWRVPIASLRAELARLVAASPVWDGRQASLEVFDAVGGHVTVRIVLTGDNPGDVGALKSYVREELVTWLQREAPYALPRTRVEVEQVEVTHDLDPEKVARAAEEIITKQKNETAGTTTAADGKRGRCRREPREGRGGEPRPTALGSPAGRHPGRPWPLPAARARRGGLGPR